MYATTRIRICNGVSCSLWSQRYDVMKGTLFYHMEYFYLVLYKYKNWNTLPCYIGICYSIILLSAPSSAIPFTIHETPPNVIQLNWELPLYDQIDFFEISIQNMSSPVDDLDGNRVILTDIRGSIFVWIIIFCSWWRSRWMFKY